MNGIRLCFLYITHKSWSTEGVDLAISMVYVFLN